MTITTLDTIRANIGLLEHRLRRALAAAMEARAAIHQGQQNLAIGTLCSIEQDLADADTLLKTSLVLHRSRANEKASVQ